MSTRSANLLVGIGTLCMIAAATNITIAIVAIAVCLIIKGVLA